MAKEKKHAAAKSTVFGSLEDAKPPHQARRSRHPPDELHVVKLCKVLQHFGSGRMPSSLFSRAVSKNPYWRLDGEIGCKDSLGQSVPAWLLTLFDQPNAVPEREIRDSWQCPFLEVQHFEGFQCYALVPHLLKHQELKCTAQEYTELLFDTIGMIAHAFPNMYAEAGWEETECQLEPVIKSVYPVLALEHKYKFLNFLKTKEPHALTQYLCNLLRVLIRCLGLIWSSPPSSLKILISEIFDLLKAIGSDNQAEPLRLRYICHKWETLLGNDSFLAQSPNANFLDSDDWATSAVIFMLNQTDAVSDKTLVTFAEGRTSSRGSASIRPPMQRLAETIVRLKEGKHEQIQLYSVGVDQLHIGILIGTILVQHKLYHLAARNFRRCLAELTSKSDYSPADFTISCVEYANCCNLIGDSSEAESWALRALRNDQRVDDQGPVLRNTSLKIALADSYICAANYPEAAKTLKSIRLLSSMMPISVLVAIALRITRVERRLGNQRQAMEPSSALMSVADNMHMTTGELLLECVEEVLCNIRLLDTGLKQSISQADHLETLAYKAKRAVRNSSPIVEFSSDWRIKELEDLDLCATSDRFSLATTLVAPSSRSLTLLRNESLMSVSSPRLRNVPVEASGTDEKLRTSALPPRGEILSERTITQKVKISRLGLSEVYSPSAGTDPVVQIVLVHGLMGDPQMTWTAIGPFHSEEKPIFWPSEFLPRFIPQAQILTWGYESVPEDLSLSTSHDSERRHGEALLSALAHFKSLTRMTPIIFVAHSWGGLIVKDALNKSLKTQDTDLRNILQQTYGVCFLATPHRDSMAAIGELAYQTNAKANKGNKSSRRNRRNKRKLLQLTMIGTQNMNHIDDKFYYLLAITSMQVCSFYEEKKTGSFGHIVSKASAIIGSPTETIASLPTDHINMTKFSSVNDVGFTRLRSQLQRWIADVQVQKQLAEEVKLDSRKLLASLYGPSTRDRFEEIGEAVPGTYDWVFDRTRVVFPDWLQENRKGNDPIFWIRGKAGSGKSTLMKHLLNDHRTLELLQSANNSPWILIGVFFSNFHSIKMTFDNVLQHMLYQIVVQNPHMRDEVGRSYHLAGDKQGTTPPQWDSVAIKDALKTIFRQREISCQIALFVDGLNELAVKDVDQLLGVIGQFVTLSDGDIVKLKVCVASRPSRSVQEWIGSCPSFMLHDYTVTDIQTYIQRSINESISTMRISISRPQIQAIVDSITTKANGVFLWVVLVVRSVLVGLRDGENLAQLERRIGLMPAGMSDLYEELVGTIDIFYAPQTYMMLQVALCALRPLSLEAFSSCIYDVPTTHNDPESFKAQEQTLIRRITTRCGGMLEVTPSPFLDENFDDQAERDIGGLKKGNPDSFGIEKSVEAARPAWRSSILRVHFVHQSFGDFFSHHQDEVLSSVGQSQRQSGYLLLLRAGVRSEDQWAHELTRDIFTYAHRIEKGIPQEFDAAAEELDSLFDTGRPLQDDPRLKRCLPPAQISCWLYLFDLLKGRDELKLLCLAVAANLRFYINRRLSPRLLVDDRAIELMLPLAILGPKIVPENTGRTDMVNLLLKIGVPVNLSPGRNLVMSFLPGRTGENDRLTDLPITSTLALILGDTENQWGMEESDRSALISLLVRNGALADVMVYRFRKGLREFREGLPALHHCVVQESPELLKLFIEHSILHIDWPISPVTYAIMRQDPAIELALAGAGFEKRHRITGESGVMSKQVLIAVSLMCTSIHPVWAVPNARRSLLANILARIKP